jgi:di/tricarboxylate transporter
MQTDQILILAILAATVAAFLWGRWRHDLVAGGALMACVLAGVVAPEQAFAGFGHPAVITVACVLVLSHGLQTSGAVDALARVALPAKAGPMLSIAALTTLAAVLSGFMNNVGALALLMPVALQIARKRKLAPGQVLMPLAFGSILGGMTTLIGTPPNLIVSGYRASTGEAPFAMFDFSPVGVAVAAAGANDEDDADDDAPAPRDPARTPHEEIVLQEIVVLPGSGLSGRSATELDLRTHHGINVLAISRAGIRSRRRLRSQRFQEGDLLLVQGTQAAISGFAAQFGAVPLAERALRMPDRRKAITASLVLAGAIAATAFGLLPAAAAFALGVVASMALRTVPPREVYTAIDWPVIVLLAALIPVAGAMESTGTADLLARGLFDSVAQGHPVLGLVLVMVVTMTLSDLMNNAATAAVMCPIAVGAATTLGVDPDPYLMAVAIGASCAFLTPIGHQNNTLILGPGGFRFGDYWRLGLPVQLVVLVVSIPLLLRIWPL